MFGMQNNINPADITNSSFLLLKLSDADKSETGILQQHEHAHLIIGYIENIL